MSDQQQPGGTPPPPNVQPPNAEPPVKPPTVPDGYVPSHRLKEEADKRREAETALATATAQARIARATAELVRAGYADVDDTSVAMVLEQLDRAHPDAGQRPTAAQFVRSEQAPAMVRRAFASASPAPSAQTAPPPPAAPPPAATPPPPPAAPPPPATPPPPVLSTHTAPPTGSPPAKMTAAELYDFVKRGGNLEALAKKGV